MGADDPVRLLPHPRSLIVAILLAAAARPGGAQAADPRRPLSVDDVLSVKEFADRVQIDLSPDGRFVAFTLRDPIRAAASSRRGSRYAAKVR